MDNKQYAIHVDSMLRLRELENILGNVDTIDLPYSEELSRAVLLINKLCSEKLRSLKRKKNEERVEELFKLIRTGQYNILKEELLDILEIKE